jgi:predicted RNA methylase
MAYYLSKSEWANSKIIPEGMNLDMLNQEGRLDLLLKPAISAVAKGNTFIDLGCGTGLLGIHALEHGAEFVYFVEQDAQMIHILENVLPKKLKSNCYKIIHKDLEHLAKEDFDQNIPTIGASEFFGPRLFDEGYVNYSKHLRSLFPDLKFIPEMFLGRFYLIDIDYEQPIWPKDKNLIEYFHFMYREKAFGQYLQNINEKELVGEISFNANTQEFKNLLEFEYLKKENKILLGEMLINHNELIHIHTHIGWFLDKEDYKKVFQIYFDKDNYFNPIKKDITPGEM